MRRAEENKRDDKSRDARREDADAERHEFPSAEERLSENRTHLTDENDRRTSKRVGGGCVRSRVLRRLFAELAVDLIAELFRRSNALCRAHKTRDNT